MTQPVSYGHTFEAEPRQNFQLGAELEIEVEIEMIIKAGFIKPCHHPNWLANIVPMRKNYGQIQCFMDFRGFPLCNLTILHQFLRKIF